MIDLRSDTVTRPTAAMREVIAAAAVGDDVIDVDPTVDQLEQRTAELLGKERAIFMPSGTMTNQVAIRVHCRPGDEFLCEERCHIYNYEQGAFAQLGGVVARTLKGAQGVLTREQFEGTIRPQNEHMVQTRMVTLENTHNLGGGRVQPYEEVVSICEWAQAHHLRTHLDGARLMNAVVATGIEAQKWASHFDTVSICFSKGLGAPVGSALAGSQAEIAGARRHRKLFGGGMRQAGIIAAGALFALENHVHRLAEDHDKAEELARTVREIPGMHLEGESVDTNIVVINIDPQLSTAREFADRLRQQREVLVLAMGPQCIRAVTHLDVSMEQTRMACDALRDTATELAEH